MKRIFLLFLLYCFCTTASMQAQNPAHRWFEEARLGMFIHFGPYSVLCDGEWVMHDKSITVYDYHKLQHIFNPQRFDAKKWVAIAKGAGMKYITFTSRHHDGFSNWDTKQSNWNIMHTPYGKDLVRQLADECHREGIKLIFYYSLLDWSREDYSFTTGRTGQTTGRTVQKDWDSYLGFMKAQLTELLTNYGAIAGIWFDGEWDQLPAENSVPHLSHEMSPVDWHFDEIYALIHSLQPDCMIANNHHLPTLPGEDYQAFEKDLPGENIGGLSAHQIVSNRLPLETCETINNSWGYRLRDNNFKTTRQLVALIVKSAGYGANLLLNVGPMSSGEIDDTSISRLKEIGDWMKVNSEAIYGTQPIAPYKENKKAFTQKENQIYAIYLADEDETKLPSEIRIESFRPAKGSKVYALGYDKPLSWKSSGAGFTVNIPPALQQHPPCENAWVIRFQQ